MASEILFSPPNIARQNLNMHIQQYTPAAPRQNRRARRKHGRCLRSPAWFLEVEAACFKCRKLIPEKARSQHVVHNKGAILYSEAILLRAEHLDQWARLFHSFIGALLAYFSLNCKQDLVELLVRLRYCEGLPVYVEWSDAQRSCLQRYYQLYGDSVEPKYVRINPPNSAMALAHPPIIWKALTEKMRAFLIRRCD